jgi:hypothetical protein
MLRQPVKDWGIQVTEADNYGVRVARIAEKCSVASRTKLQVSLARCNYFSILCGVYNGTLSATFLDWSSMRSTQTVIASGMIQTEGLNKGMEVTLNIFVVATLPISHLFCPSPLLTFLFHLISVLPFALDPFPLSPPPPPPPPLHFWCLCLDKDLTKSAEPFLRN